MVRPLSVVTATRLARRRANAAREGRRHGTQRGFTMTEMLTVISIISVLAAAAAPSFIRMMQDRRVRAAANEVADVYRVARMRAMGRGAAVMVRWNQTAFPPTAASPYGHFAVREAVVGSGASAVLPSTSCLGTDWSNTGLNSRPVRSFDERKPKYYPSAATFIDPGGSQQSYSELCFTPRGRAFIRFNAGASFAPMNGVPRVDVINIRTQLRRRVVIPSTGIARVVTAI